MKITNVILMLFVGLLPLSATAMQPANNDQQEAARLYQLLDGRTIAQNIANHNFDEIDANITFAQGFVQLLRDQVHPELMRRQRAAEFYTISPVIHALLGQLDNRFLKMREALQLLRHYDAELDGAGNTAYTQLKNNALSVKIALTKLFRIINQQPFNRNPQTPSFSQCLQQAPLAKQAELVQTCYACYQRWFVNQPAAPAPAPANAQRVPGQENIEKWRNFLMDLYMQWLVKLENADLLIDNLTDYLAPDNAHEGNVLQQGHDAVQAAAEYVPNLHGDLGRIAAIGRQIDGQLERLQASAEDFERDQWLVDRVHAGLRGGAWTFNGIAGGVGAAYGFMQNVFALGLPDIANGAEEPAPAAPNPVPAAAAPAAQNAPQQQPPMNAEQWRQLFQNLRQLFANNLINIPENIQAGLGEHHLNVGGRLQGIDAYVQYIQRTLVHPFTRDQRLGSQEFRAWLQGKAAAWNAAVQQARAAPIAEHH